MHGLFNFLDLCLNRSVVHGVDVDGLSIVVLNHLFELIKVGLDRVNIAVIEFVSRFFEGSPCLVHDLIGHVAQFNLGLSSLVFFGELLSLGDLLLDFIFAQGGGGFNLDGLLLSGAHVLCTDVHDAVGVDVEGHLNLRHASRCGRDANELELAQSHVVSGELSLTLEDVNFNRWLVVGGGGVNL